MKVRKELLSLMEELSTNREKMMQLNLYSVLDLIVMNNRINLLEKRQLVKLKDLYFKKGLSENNYTKAIALVIQYIESEKQLYKNMRSYDLPDKLIERANLDIITFFIAFISKKMGHTPLSVISFVPQVAMYSLLILIFLSIDYGQLEFVF